MTREPDINDIRRAADGLRPHIHRTPVLTCSWLNDLCGAELLFKCENFQKAGSFKIRGALNAVLSLTDDEAARGVVTHSSGNFGAALAPRRADPRHRRHRRHCPPIQPGSRWTPSPATAREWSFANRRWRRGRPAPHRCWRRQGGRCCIPTTTTGSSPARGRRRWSSARIIPTWTPSSPRWGAGGLLGGTLLATTALLPAAAVYAGGAARGGRRLALARGRRTDSAKPETTTIADGLRTLPRGSRNFPIIRRLVREIILVSEEEIVSAMRLIWERMKIVVEPSSAVTLAALRANPAPFAGRKVGLILSGGNVDLAHLPFRD